MARAIATVIKTLIATMANAVKKFRDWLANRRNFLFSRYTKDAQETQEPERTLIALPDEVRKKLVTAVESLSSNPADKRAISEAIEKSFELWRKDPNNADNSIVILSSPVASVSRILSETLEEWAKQKQIPLKLLPFTSRPYAIETICSKLKHELDSREDEDEDSLEIVVIPNLSWCFLRTLEGLEGIEYLQSLLYNGSKNRFWIIGGGEVGWQYLNSVCAIEAYCGQVFVLPELAPEDLESWLDPIINELDITFDEPRIKKQILDGDKDNKTNYFDRLADISKGVGTVAIQAFLKSIHYEEADEDEPEDKNIPEPQTLVAQIPRLPKLAELESADQYLLYSLLLHGDLTIAALSESLGDLESEVQGRVQLLRREGIVEERDRILKINPIHYPKIKQKLAANNFIINRE